MPDVQVSVLATISVEVHVGNWNESTSFKDLHEIAGREAKVKLQNILNGKARIVGQPDVKIVTTTKE